MQTYEIEIKSLLRTRENAESLIERMRASDPQFKELGKHRQLNHYFTGSSPSDLETLTRLIEPHIEPSKLEQLKDIVVRGKNCSVRTRLADEDVILVIKASVDDASSSNGTARLEVEVRTPKLSLEQLDALVIGSGLAYQAKWSRERREFIYRELNVSIDKNAGYGFLAEFEAIVEDRGAIEPTRNMIYSVMANLKVSELPQDRLERMFAHYNKNWQDYYGTEKTFIVE